MRKKSRHICGLAFILCMIWSTIPMEAVFAVGNKSGEVVVSEKGDTVIQAAEVIESGTWNYLFSDGAAIVQSYKGNETSIEIPASVDYNGKTYEVKGVGESAFDGNTYLQSVTIPENITTLGKYAFRNCTNLNKIVINSNLDSASEISHIFYNAGRNGGGISVIFGNNVTKIPDYLFDSYDERENGNHARVKSIQMSDSITIVGQAAFSCCLDIEKIVWSKNLEEIHPDSFQYNESLTEIILPNNVKYIGERAFENCIKAEKIATPEREMLCVADGAFSQCVSLNNLTIGGDLGNRSIENPMPGDSFFEEADVFANAGAEANTLEVVFKNGVTVIPDGLFASPYYAGEKEYPHLTSVQIPDTVKKIGIEAFGGCKDLERATILGDMVEIYSNSFLNTTTIYGYAGSYVESQAKKYGIPFVVLKEEVNSPFLDVKETDWFCDAVSYVYEKGIMSGLTTSLFGPNETLTRSQFAAILYRMTDSPEVQYTNKFSDVPDNEWYTDGIIWSSEKGIVYGYNDGRFGTEDFITREQMSVMFYRYAKYMKYDISQKGDLSKFNDKANISEFAVDAMEWAVGAGLISGKDNGTKVDPQGNATRAECAAIIMRFMEKYGK